MCNNIFTLNGEVLNVNSLFKLSMAVLLGAMALCTYVTVASGLIDKLAYQSYTHEARYSVVDVDARGKVTVEYTVDGDIHEHQVVSPYGSYAVGDTGVLRYERADVPVLDTEVRNNVKYSKIISLMLVLCLAVLIIYRVHAE